MSIKRSPLLISFLISSSAFANSSPQMVLDDELLISEIKNAVPLKRVEPKYPIQAAKRGQEGWTEVSFIVEKDGSVSSAIVEDSSGSKEFNKASLRAIKKWRYQPAVEDGEPVQQCNQSVRLDYSLGGEEQRGASRRFVASYKEISALIEAGKLGEAQERLSKLRNKTKWNLYEDAWFWNLSSQYYRVTNDKANQLKSVNRVLSARGFAPNDMRLRALVDAFILNYNGVSYAKALANFEQIKKAQNSETTVATLQPYVNKLHSLIAGDKPIVKASVIENQHRWRHLLVRNRFALEDVSGQLSKLEIRCKNKVFSYNAAAQNTWVIPRKWQQCYVYIDGTDNTQFKFVELANS